jgi:sugar porter (SP) family MFS transporter
MNENRRYITLVALIVALGGFLMGFDASVISGVVKFIEPEFGLTKLELGWAVSSLTLTSTLAMLVVGPISDRVGRKRILSYAAIIYTISAIGSAFAPSFWVLVVARMIGGLGVGASLIIAPMYIAEIAPAKLRGRLVSFNQLNIVIGISTAFFTNYLILQLGKSDASWAQNLNFDIWNWRWMLGLEAVPAIIYFFALFVVPRSPRWLIMKGKEELALEIMQKAVGSAKATTDLQDIRNSIQQDKNKAKASFKDIFKPAVRTVLVIGIVIAILQQITGINSVFFYAPMIFEQAGLGTDAAFTQAIFVGLINLVFTLLAIAFIDRFGRKPLLMFGLSGITISMMVLAFGFHSATYKLTPELQNTLPEIINENMIVEMSDKTYNSEEEFLENAKVFIAQEDITKHEEVLINKSIQLNTGLILFGILAFVASFAVSIGPVMWVLFSELFPNSIRAITISFVGFINSAISFLVQLVFPWELENFGSPLTFFIYGAFAFLGLLFIIRKVPETKGKSLEELEEILTKK